MSDQPGYSRSKWNQVTAESNLRVPFGNGKVTSIIGWREYTQREEYNVDSTPIYGFEL